MWKRFRLLLTGHVAIFGIITGYEQLADGGVRAWIEGQGWQLNVVVLTYWVVPLVIFIITEGLWAFTDHTIKFLNNKYLNWKLAKTLKSTPKRPQITNAINYSRSRGLLTQSETRELGGIVRELSAIERSLLVLLDDPLLWSEKNTIVLPSWERGTWLKLIEFAFPLLRNKPRMCKTSINNLYARNLLQFDDKILILELERKDLLQPITTNLGHKMAHLIIRGKNTPLYRRKYSSEKKQ